MKVREISREQAMQATVNYGGVVNLPPDQKTSAHKLNYSNGRLGGPHDQKAEIYLSDGKYFARIWEHAS